MTGANTASAAPADPDRPTCEVHHGGDLAAAARRFGEPAAGWLDLSTGINPWPYPVPPLPAAAWTRLPEPAAVAALEAVAAACFGVPTPAAVVAAPGSQAVIQWLPHLRRPGTVAVVGPTYGEHAASWRRAGHAVAEVSGDDLGTFDTADVVVVTNPNNPDGRCRSAAALSRLADRLAARGAWLVVDEAFADVVPAVSVAAAAAAHPTLVVIRSFGKFFGLAGLRLGFAVAAPATVAGALRRALGPWAVGGAAVALAPAALADTAWIGRTRARLAAAARRLDALLEAYELTPVGGTSLFRLAHSPDAPKRFAALAHAGVWVRAFDDRPGLLRFGLPGDAAAWQRLAAALATPMPDDRASAAAPPPSGTGRPAGRRHG